MEKYRSSSADNKSEELSMTPQKEPFDYKEFITWILGAMNGFFGLILLVKKVFFKEKQTDWSTFLFYMIYFY